MVFSRVRRWWGFLLSSGQYPGESEVHRGRRRIVVGYALVGFLPRVFFATTEFSDGLGAAGWIDLIAAFVPLAGVFALRARPDWYIGVVNILLLALILENLAATVIYGGLFASGSLIVFGLIVVVGALIALDRAAARWWLLIYVTSVVLAVIVPHWVDPIYDVESSEADAASVIIFTAILLYAGMAYFVRDRDRFQHESDDLLHNILPNEIASRLKSGDTLIADSHDAASVLFADVVGFTPMSAGMSPTQLVELLNAVFSTFDGFVADLGLEKIKTVGDEYMVASGVPHPRADHAHALASLALRIRDHVDKSRFEGHRIRLRIGINSGPVVAGIVGTHKFSYDLWGDVVNTASRMESEGLPGAIQITQATYGLIKDDFLCSERGEIPVKGKGPMLTYILVSDKIGGPTGTAETTNR
jgi:adenylate cyclase